MNTQSENMLTPRQAAEVIRYYDKGVNAEARTGEWKAKKPLVLMAIQTTLEDHSFLPDGEPLLTFDEAAAGYAYLVAPNKSQSYYDEMKNRVANGRSVAEALRELDREGWE